MWSTCDATNVRAMWSTKFESWCNWWYVSIGVLIVVIIVLCTNKMNIEQKKHSIARCRTYRFICDTTADHLIVIACCFTCQSDLISPIFWFPLASIVRHLQLIVSSNKVINVVCTHSMDDNIRIFLIQVIDYDF